MGVSQVCVEAPPPQQVDGLGAQTTTRLQVTDDSLVPAARRGRSFTPVSASPQVQPADWLYEFWDQLPDQNFSGKVQLSDWRILLYDWLLSVT